MDTATIHVGRPRHPGTVPARVDTGGKAAMFDMASIPTKENIPCSFRR
jgi:hypothetical protein